VCDAAKNSPGGSPEPPSGLNCLAMEWGPTGEIHPEPASILGSIRSRHEVDPGSTHCRFRSTGDRSGPTSEYGRSRHAAGMRITSPLPNSLLNDVPGVGVRSGPHDPDRCPLLGCRVRPGPKSRTRVPRVATSSQSCGCLLNRGPPWLKIDGATPRFCDRLENWGAGHVELQVNTDPVLSHSQRIT
jgi:hypothetical protein